MLIRVVSGIITLEKNTINLKPLFLVSVLAAAPVVHGDVFYVTKTADTADGSCTATDCSLREAVIASNGSTGADTIHLPPGSYALLIPGAGEDAAATGDLDIASEVTILGDPYMQTVVDGSGLDRVFHVVAGVIVRLEWLTIQYGNYFSGGGGVAVTHSMANVTLDRCLVRDNTTTGFGGGLANWGDVLYIRNSTITGNTASQGGGVAALGDGTLALIYSTVKGNVATTASNGMQVQGHAGPTVLLSGTIIDNGRATGSACSIGTLISNGHNIESPSDTCGLYAVGDQENVTASALALGALGWNGGPSRTYPLGPASVAVNLGNVGNYPAVDQRGGPRIDGHSDIGSFELGAVPPVLIFRDGFESGGSSAWSSTVP